MNSRIYTDQLHRSVSVPERPMRIVSLVPSQTELLYALGLDEEVVGITKFCTHPDHWYRSKTRIGGTKQLHFDKIRDLKPDLILANKEENTKEDIDTLSREFPVWVSDVNDRRSALIMIDQIGNLVGREIEAKDIANSIGAAFQKLSGIDGQGEKLRVLYLIWRNPYMAAGRGTFISAMLEEAGLRNCIQTERYPQLTGEEIKELDPDLVLLSSEPYPFTETHVAEIARIVKRAQAEGNTPVKCVDGRLFSWYGSALLESPDYFLNLFHKGME